MGTYRVLLAVVACCAWIAQPLAADRGEDPLERYFYDVKHTLAGGTVHWVGGTLAVPAEYRIIDINHATDRLYVCAVFWSEPEGVHRSELWEFDAESRSGSVAFESRTVLASYELHRGESLNLCRNVVSCHAGVALFVQKWERGITRVFSSEWVEISVEWPKSKAESGSCCVDFVRPVAWVPGPSGTFELACMLSEHGDLDPYMLYWTFDSGVRDRGPLDRMLRENGTDLFNGFDRFW